MTWLPTSWDIPGAIKELAPLARDLVRIVAPSAAERAAGQDVDLRSKKEQAADALKTFKIRMRQRREFRLLAAERDKAELEKLFDPDGGSEPPS